MATDHPVMPSGFTLKPITGEVMESAVALHQRALYYSINSRLGARHLTYLYSAMRQDPTCLVMAAVSQSEVLGVVSATLDPGRFTRRLFARLPAQRWPALLARLACEPGIGLEWLGSRSLSRPVQYLGAEVKTYLTTIAISQAARRQGVGRALISTVDDFARRNGRSAYHLDTRSDNATARAFYQRLGFVELEERGGDVIFVRQL